MTKIRPSRTAIASVAMAALVGGQALSAPSARAVSATKAELRNGQLKVEGRGAPGAFTVVESTTSAAGARADQNGSFRVQAAGFTAPDCIVTIRDGRTPTATVTISGCTPTVAPVPPEPAAPTGTCVIVPTAPTTISAGRPAVVSFETAGCDTTTGSGATPTPVQWTVVAGVLPAGMTGPTFQGSTGGNISGTPTIAGTYRFTLQVTDQVHAADQENVTVTVA